MVRLPRLALFSLVLLSGCAVARSEPTTVADSTPTSTSASVAAEPAAPTLEFAPIAALDGDPGGLFAYTDPGQLPRLFVSGVGDESTLPLEHTDVDARVRGHVAQVRVTQQFHNDRDHAIEVTYSFPLPENSAVDDMRMVVGERVIESEVQTRDHARQTYEAARRQGHTAALLEQERPNIFTQSVANVAPGETIEVEISYLQTLSQDGGTYEFVFPMVVGPRFIPPGDAVPDAARITPPIVGEGQRSGNDVSLTLNVDAGAAIDSWVSPTHSITATTTSQGFSARLRDAETVPNRDFVLRWQAAGATTHATLFMSQPDADGGGHFALVIQPPQLDLDAIVGRREMIFVVDRSGSMSGIPLALAKQTLRESLSRLRPVDTFDIVGFASGTSRLFGTPRPANEHNLVLAERFIDGIDAGGGTMMADAVEAALAPRLSPDVHRYVFFLTDGFIGNEEQIFSGARQLILRAQQSGARARVFGLGIGSSPNRELIAGLSKAGDGVPLYVGNREHPSAAVDSYFHYVDHPVLDDISVNWGGLAVQELYPNDRLALFASHTKVVLGRYQGQVQGNVTITARTPDSNTRVEIPVALAPSASHDRIFATLWARAKLDELDAAIWDGDLDRAAAEQAITQIGLDYHLVTAYTSFVAVDRSRVIGDGNPEAVTQPVEIPEDVDYTNTVNISATANRDSAGISLAGTSGVESRYSVQGAERVREIVIKSSDLRYGAPAPSVSLPRSNWAPNATLRIKQLEVSEGIDERAAKRALRADAIKFEACYEQRVGHPGKRRLRFRLRFDAHGRLLEAKLLDGSLGSEEISDCITAVLQAVAWDGLAKAASTIEFELLLRMR